MKKAVLGAALALLIGACSAPPPPAAQRLVSAQPTTIRVTSAPSASGATAAPTMDPALDLNPPQVHPVDVRTAPSPAPTPNYAEQCVWTRGPDSKKVALVFDVGARTSNIVPVLDALAEIGQRATFFVTGEYAAQNPDTFKLLARDGHEFAVHGYYHVSLEPLATSLLLADIRNAERTLAEKSGGRAPARIVRLPFGAGSDVARMTTALCDQGFKVASWEVADPGAQEGYDAKDLSRTRITELVTGGRILYLKSTGADNARALANVIGLLEERGLVATTLSDVMGYTQAPWTRPVWPRPTPVPSASPSPRPTASPAP